MNMASFCHLRRWGGALVAIIIVVVGRDIARGLLEETDFRRFMNGLRARGDREFVVDIADMVDHGVIGDKQFAGNFRIAVAERYIF